MVSCYLTRKDFAELGAITEKGNFQMGASHTSSWKAPKAGAPSFIVVPSRKGFLKLNPAPWIGTRHKLDASEDPKEFVTMCVNGSGVFAAA